MCFVSNWWLKLFNTAICLFQTKCTAWSLTSAGPWLNTQHQPQAFYSSAVTGDNDNTHSHNLLWMCQPSEAQQVTEPMLHRCFQTEIKTFNKLTSLINRTMWSVFDLMAWTEQLHTVTMSVDTVIKHIWLRGKHAFRRGHEGNTTVFWQHY